MADLRGAGGGEPGAGRARDRRAVGAGHRLASQPKRVLRAPAPAGTPRSPTRRSRARRAARTTPRSRSTRSPARRGPGWSAIWMWASVMCSRSRPRRITAAGAGGEQRLPAEASASVQSSAPRGPITCSPIGSPSVVVAARHRRRRAAGQVGRDAELHQSSKAGSTGTPSIAAGVSALDGERGHLHRRQQQDVVAVEEPRPRGGCSRAARLERVEVLAADTSAPAASSRAVSASISSGRSSSARSAA